MRRTLFALFVIAFFLPVSTISAAEKPNVILIFIDDMGYGDVGFNGAKGPKTPHLDVFEHVCDGNFLGMQADLTPAKTRGHRLP